MIRSRIVAIDEMRALALAGMVAYHLGWDLQAFGLLGPDPSRDLAWRTFGHAVASVFLGLSGLGLSLADQRRITLRHSLVRLARIAGAATLVTLATVVLAPAMPVWFGILHCIVVTNLVALGLRRCPTPFVMGIAVCALAVPWIFQLELSDRWAWTGLSPPQTPTLDFRPFLPCLAPVLFGMAVGRTQIVDWLAARRSPAWTARWPAFAGRHTLVLYLGHQPVLIGLILLLAGPAGSGSEPAGILTAPQEAAAFLSQCKASCVAAGSATDPCEAKCHCALSAILAKPIPDSIDRLVGAFRPAFGGLDEALALCRR